VEIVGAVNPLLDLRALLSDTPCVIYQVELTLLQRLREGRLLQGHRATVGSRFLVQCRLGPVLVDTEAARIRLPEVTRHRLIQGRDRYEDARLAALYKYLRRPLTRQGVTCKERRLRPGERVWLVGSLVVVADPRGLPSGYREPPRMPLLRAEELRVISG